MATIRIDEEVYSWLQGQARAFEDTPNSVLRRIAGLDKIELIGQAKRKIKPRPRGDKTPQGDYRAPILKILAKHGGQASRMTVIAELEKAMSGQLTEFDKEDIETGGLRWQKSAEFEVHVMRKANLLKPADHTPHGYWALAEQGKTSE